MIELTKHMPEKCPGCNGNKFKYEISKTMYIYHDDHEIIQESALEDLGDVRCRDCGTTVFYVDGITDEALANEMIDA